MPFRVHWADAEHTLMRCDIQAPWTWEEFDAAWRQFYEMGSSAQHPVICAVDAHLMGLLPRNALRVIHDRYSVLPPNISKMVVVNAPTMLRVIVDVMSLIRPDIFKCYHFVPTFDEAQRLLNTRLS